LLTDDWFLCGRELGIFAQLGFALPERAEDDSGLLSRLKETERRKPQRNCQEQATFARRADSHECDEYRRRNDQPGDAPASAASCSVRTDVRNVLGHARTTALRRQ
jgi:hypothetical protein